jgi:hypothetical protein
VAFLAVDDPRQVDARLADEVAAELDGELGAAQLGGSAANRSPARADRGDVERRSPWK